MAKAKSACRKCRSTKAQPEAKEEDSKTGDAEKAVNLKVANKEQISEDVKCTETKPADIENTANEEDGSEGSDALKGKSPNSRKKNEMKSNRGKRNQEMLDNTKEKNVKGQQAVAVGKGKKKVLQKKAEVKEEVNGEVDRVTEEASVSEELEKAVISKEKDDVNDDVKVENKRGKRKKNEVDVGSKKAKEAVSNKKNVEVNGSCTDVIKRQDKRCNRGLKRAADEDCIVKTTEDEGIDGNEENFFDFRCIDHQNDKVKGMLCFKLMRSDSGKGEKVRLLTAEEAKKFATDTCFDYMVNKLAELS
uniref:RanBD1 domain-containing protein n=1 Tax=Syphacia muris TaxID=451379 RepID=A0A0N5ARI7_9BILA